MINQKMILALIVGFVVMFGLAGLFHMVIMKDYFITMLGGQPEMMYTFLSYFILALLMSIFYPMMNKAGSVIQSGLIFGILVGLLCRVPLLVLHVGYGNGDLRFVITEGVWHAIEEGIGGIAIAMMYQRGSVS
jgi:hypothetical protein